MITVSTETYKNIEKSMERWYNSSKCPWSRMFENNKRLGKPEVIKRFDLECIDIGDQKVRVRLVNKENSEYVPFDEVFDRFV